MNPPKLKPFVFFSRGFKVLKEFDVGIYKIYYLFNIDQIKVIECADLSKCIQTLCVKKDGHFCA